MVLQGVVYIVNDVPMAGAVGMHVRDDMALREPRVGRVAVRITVMVVTVLSTCGLRSGDKSTLDGKGHRGRHHDDDSNLPQQKVRQTAQLWISEPHCSSAEEVYIR
jgi:hypothetical protein